MMIFLELYRILTLIKKELTLILQDKQTLAMLMAPIIIQVCIFPFSATLEVNHATVGIYRNMMTQPSNEIIDRISHSKNFSNILFLSSEQEIKQAIDKQKVLLVVRFDERLAQKLISSDLQSQSFSKIQLILDGRHSNSAQIAANYIQQIVTNYQQERLCEIKQQCSQNQIVVRNWFNSNLNFKWFIVPSLIALITTIGVLAVTALSVAREKEQGTFDQLCVSPLATWQIFIGKAIPAIVVATIQSIIVLLAAIFLYQIPFQGLFFIYFICLVSYGLSLVGYGMFISVICSTQQQAFIGIIVFMVPSVLLSGYISPIENMPIFLQKLTYLNPVRHFIKLTKEIYLKDIGFEIVWQSLVPLLIITVIFGSLAYFLFKRKLE